MCTSQLIAYTFQIIVYTLKMSVCIPGDSIHIPSDSVYTSGDGVHIPDDSDAAAPWFDISIDLFVLGSTNSIICRPFATASQQHLSLDL